MPDNGQIIKKSFEITKTNKWLWIFVTISGILILSYFLTTGYLKNQKLSGEALYTNSKYGYSFSYNPNRGITHWTCGNRPDDFTKQEKLLMGPNAPDPASDVCFPLEGYPPIQIHVDAGDTTGTDSIKRDFTGGWIIDLNDRLVGGVNALNIQAVYTDDDPSGLIPRQISQTRIFYNGITYVITLGYPEYNQTYEEITESFKFAENR